jgi:hypothetical protein
MIVENWLPVKDYEGFYEVSDLGRVRSLRFGKVKIMKQSLSSNKYLIVNLWNDKKMKSYSVHILVASAFLGHVPNGRITVVNHINFDRLDNRSVNLEVISFRENANKKHLPSTSKYTGVYWNKDSRKWVSRISICGRVKYLGRFTTELDAHYAYEEELAKITK